MDVYLFIQTEPGLATTVMNSIVDAGMVSRAAIVTGPFDVFARIDGIEWDELAGRLVDGVHRVPGIVRTETAAALDPTTVMDTTIPIIKMPLRAATRDRVALVFASLQRGTAAEAVPALARTKGVLGLALITGNHDVLLQVAGRSIEEIAGTIMNRIHAIPGVMKTSTALVLRATPLPKVPKRG